MVDVRDNQYGDEDVEGGECQGCLVVKGEPGIVQEYELSLLHENISLTLSGWATPDTLSQFVQWSRIQSECSLGVTSPRTPRSSILQR